jgi:hypothetical protein
MLLKKSLTVFGSIVIVLCIAAPLALQGDVFIKQKNHTDGFSMMGQTQPAKDEMFETWMGQNKARMDHGEDSSIIIRLDKNVMCLVDHSKMQYVEMAIGGKNDIFSSALSSSNLSGEEQAQAKKMMEGFTKMMKPSVTVTASGETQKINNWNCNKYSMKMSMMGTTSNFDIWATENIKIDYDLYRNLAFSIMGQTPGVEDMMKEMSKIKGIVVLQQGTMSMMGTDVKSSQELIEVSDKDAPAGTYEVPQGYKKQN